MTETSATVISLRNRIWSATGANSSKILRIWSVGAMFLVFRLSELAVSVALAAIGELRSSILERAATGCKYLNKENVSRCYGMIQEKITLGDIVLKSAGSSMSSMPQSLIGVLGAAACPSRQSDAATAGSSFPAACYHSSSISKRRRISRRLM